MKANKKKSFFLQTTVRKSPKSFIRSFISVVWIRPKQKDCLHNQAQVLFWRLWIYPFRRSISEWIRGVSIQPKHKMALTDFHYVPHLIKMEAALSHETSCPPLKLHGHHVHTSCHEDTYDIWRSVSIIKTNRLMLFRDMS